MMPSWDEFPLDVLLDPFWSPDPVSSPANSSSTDQTSATDESSLDSFESIPFSDCRLSSPVSRPNDGSSPEEDGAGSLPAENSPEDNPAILDNTPTEANCLETLELFPEWLSFDYPEPSRKIRRIDQSQSSNSSGGRPLLPPNPDLPVPPDASNDGWIKTIVDQGCIPQLPPKAPPERPHRDRTPTHPRYSTRVACQNCARQKLRCDCQRPCQRCIHNNRAPTCTDRQHVLHRRRRSPSPIITQSKRLRL